MSALTLEIFLRDVANHKMTVIRHSGCYRHVRFGVPGSRMAQFDLVTWPGHLCYTGDMGSYVFQRATDMFEFFRRSRERKPFQISFGYWAEKLQATDSKGATQWSPQAFADFVEQVFVDYNEEQEADSGATWNYDSTKLYNDIKSCVLSEKENEHEAREALHDYEYHKMGLNFSFPCDDLPLFTEFTPRFVWCCYALEWAIGVYDEAQP